MAMKGYSAFPKAPASLEPHHQIVRSRTLVGGVLPLCRSAVDVFYSPSRLGNLHLSWFVLFGLVLRYINYYWLSNAKSGLFVYIRYIWGARGVMVIVVEMDTATRVQILDETDSISHSTNTLGKGMNPIILPPAMGK